MSNVDLSKPEEKAKITDRCWTEEFGLNPDNEIVKDAHWFQVITRSAHGVLANSVSKCELDEKEIDKRIADTIGTYRKLGNAFHWVVAPSSRPHDLAKRLTAAGMRAGGAPYGLIGDVKTIKAAKQANVSVEPLSEQNAEEYKSILSPTDFIEPHAVDRHRKHVHHHLKEKQHLVSHYLAKVAGKPAGAGQIRYHGHYAFIPGGTPHVKPEFRANGVFGALVAHMAADAAKRGIGAIATYAGERDYPELPNWLDAGFEKTVKYHIYLWHPS